MKIPYFVATLTMAGLVSYLALASAEERKSTMSPDAKFAQTAAMGSMTEIETGHMAEKMGSTTGVKELGAMMVKDHTTASNKLKPIAMKENIELPTQLDAKHQAVVDALKKESGPAFDKLYVNDMVAAHKKAVAAFKTEIKDGHNAEMKAFATEFLPIIEGHLKHAEELQASLK